MRYCHRYRGPHPNGAGEGSLREDSEGRLWCCHNDPSITLDDLPYEVVEFESELRTDDTYNVRFDPNDLDTPPPARDHAAEQAAEEARLEEEWQRRYEASLTAKQRRYLELERMGVTNRKDVKVPDRGKPDPKAPPRPEPATPPGPPEPPRPPRPPRPRGDGPGPLHGVFNGE